MTSLPSYRLHTDAFMALLAGLAPDVLVGDGEFPAGGGWQDTPGQARFVGYVIVYPVNVTHDGTIENPQDDAEFVWQTTCVGADRRQTEAIVDRVMGLVIDKQPTVTGRGMTNHLRLQDDGGGVRRDEFHQQPPLWMSTPRFAVTSTPN